MACRLTPEERLVRERYDRALTGIKNNITELSDQITSIEADLKDLKPVVQIYKREEITKVKARVVFLQMKAAINQLSNDPKTRTAEWSVLCRQIGNFIYDIVSVWTGYMSDELIEQKGQPPNVKECNEHFFPRQRAGAFIANEYLRNHQTFDRFYSLISRFRLTHKTTQAENERLRRVQRTGVSLRHWRIDYREAGVRIRKPDHPRPFLLTSVRRQTIKELLSSLEHFKELKRVMVAERVATNKRLKARKQWYQKQAAAPSKLPTFSEERLNTISVEGDDSFKYASSTHGQPEGADRQQKQSL